MTEHSRDTTAGSFLREAELSEDGFLSKTPQSGRNFLSTRLQSETHPPQPSVFPLSTEDRHAFCLMHCNLIALPVSFDPLPFFPNKSLVFLILSWQDKILGGPKFIASLLLTQVLLD